MSSVLFDLPGPRARQRHRIGSVATLVVLLAVLGWVGWKFYTEDQFTKQKWEPFVTPDIMGALFDGLLITLSVAAVAIVCSIIFGMIFASGRLSDHAVIRWPCFLVVEFFRAVPVLLMIVVISLTWFDLFGAFWSLVIALVLYNGSVLAEVFRAGMLAVPKGQSEAAYAIGLRKNQVMRLVLLPQAITIMLPAIISQCVVALKDSLLGFAIPYDDLITGQGKAIYQQFFNIVPTVIVMATIFILINYGLSRFAQWLERRLARRGRSSAKAPAVGDVGLGDQTVAGA